jgi:hypothetical protein
MLDVRLQGKAVRGVMESFLTFVGAVAVIVVVAVVLVVIIKAVLSAQEARRKFFESASRRLQGRHVEAGFLSCERIEFNLSGRPSQIEFVSPGKNEPGRTTVQVPLGTASPGTLHILPEGFGQSFLKMFGAQDLSVGDPAFDAAYVVKATPESLAARVFSPDRRSRVMTAVRRLSPFSHPTIELTREQLRVQVREELQNEGGLLALVKTAEEFLEFLRLEPPVAGIQLGEVTTTRGSACPVCGTAMDDLAVRCESCKTPHHAECWKYMGRCSTYACKGMRSVA